jgi:MFS family permease
MGSVVPALAGWIGVLITVVNMLLTFAPVYLIDERRVGRKRLMVGSAAGMAAAAALLGAGLVAARPALSAAAMLLMVAAFATGLGPVPFVILPELVPPRVSPIHPLHISQRLDSLATDSIPGLGTQAVSAATSLGLTLNWTANFLIGAAFLPTKNYLARFDALHTGGAVFAIFALCNLVSAVLIAKMYIYTPQ